MIIMPPKKISLNTGNESRFRDTDQYPDNLLLALEILPSSHEEYHKQQIKGLEIVLNSLDESERVLITERFRDLKTMEECAKSHNVSKQCVNEKEHRILKKMRHPTRMMVISYGPDMVRRYEELKDEVGFLEERAKVLRDEIRISEEALKESMKVPQAPSLEQKKEWAQINIAELHLSPKASSPLIRHERIRTLYDLSKYSHQDLLKVRQLGAKTVQEIEQKAAAFGLYIEKQ